MYFDYIYAFLKSKKIESKTEKNQGKFREKILGFYPDFSTYKVKLKAQIR